MDLLMYGGLYVIVSLLLGGATGRGSFLAAWGFAIASFVWWIGLVIGYPTAGPMIGGVVWLGWAFAAGAFGFGFLGGIMSRRYAFNPPYAQRFDTLFSPNGKWRWDRNR